jgi:hypothetical protein
MSTTPVAITLRANEWGIIADMLEDASNDWDKAGLTLAARTAAMYARNINIRIEGK